jgi:hypothetical protein
MKKNQDENMIIQREPCDGLVIFETQKQKGGCTIPTNPDSPWMPAGYKRELEQRKLSEVDQQSVA